MIKQNTIVSLSLLALVILTSYANVFNEWEVAADQRWEIGMLETKNMRKTHEIDDYFCSKDSKIMLSAAMPELTRARYYNYVLAMCE